MRRAISAIILLALTVVPAPNAAADETTVRSGTIVTGGDELRYFVGDALEGCRMAPDCRAWLEADCDPALSGRDVGLTASIEDVADLADGTTPWRFELERDSSCCGGAGDLQLWSRNCTEITGSRWRSRQCDHCSSTVLRIPRAAKWMTVTGFPRLPWVNELLDPDSLTLEWTLTGPATQPLLRRQR